MKKEAKVTFTLSESEIREAFYDVYVRILKDNKINTIFGAGDIDIN